MAFFISGLPGAIDYLLLVLVKYDKVPVIVQKRVCASLNVYMRGPFILVSAYTMYIALLYKNTTVPISVGLFIFFVSVFNSLYYTKTTVANAAISQAIGLFEKSMPRVVPDYTTLIQELKDAKKPINLMS